MKLREEKLKNLLKWKQTRIMGGLHHITEAYDSYLETEFNESEKIGAKRTLLVKQHKKISDSLVVDEVWEHESEDENQQKSTFQSPEKQREHKKNLSIDFNVGDTEHCQKEPAENKSISSGETLMQVAQQQAYHLSLIVPKKANYPRNHPH